MSDASAPEPCTKAPDTWCQVSSAGSPSGRFLPLLVWTEREVIVWGGDDGTSSTGNPVYTGARYDPSSDTWTPMAEAPGLVVGRSAVWTGTEMIVWSGWGGAAYDPKADAWRLLATDGQPSLRVAHSVVWTSDEMIVWGGRALGMPAFGDGARYDLATDTWTPVSVESAPAPRAGHAAVWTGTEMIIWGGGTGGDPADSVTYNSGGRYDPATDTWSPTSLEDAPSPRSAFGVWTGSEMIIWGGSQLFELLGDGARYDPAKDLWRPMNPGPPRRAAPVWTGSEMILWGGDNAEGPLLDGTRYDPATNTWMPIADEGAPVQLSDYSMVWAGASVFVWGMAGDFWAPATERPTGGARYFP